MERLTYRLEDQYGNPTDSIILESDLIFLNSSEKWKKVLSRLAAYEDTGLEPKEIDEVFDEYNDVLKAIIKDGERMITNDRLRELVEMDSAGCIPPCKIGDVFYRVYYGFDSPEIEKYRVSMVTQKADRSWRIRATDTESSFQIDWSLDDFSKRAYKTREEAEAALAKIAD